MSAGPGLLEGFGAGRGWSPAILEGGWGPPGGGLRVLEGWVALKRGRRGTQSRRPRRGGEPRQPRKPGGSRSPASGDTGQSAPSASHVPGPHGAQA